MRGLRLEMLMDRVKGDIEVVDEYLFNALRDVRHPVTYTYHSARRGEDDPYRYLRLPVAKEGQWRSP